MTRYYIDWYLMEQRKTPNFVVADAHRARTFVAEFLIEQDARDYCRQRNEAVAA